MEMKKKNMIQMMALKPQHERVSCMASAIKHNKNRLFFMIMGFTQSSQFGVMPGIPNIFSRFLPSSIRLCFFFFHFTSAQSARRLVPFYPIVYSLFHSILCETVVKMEFILWTCGWYVMK